MRDDILKFIKKELIGPDPIKPHIQENGEEILLNEPPRLRYGASVLFPRAATFEKADSTTSEEEKVLEKHPRYRNGYDKWASEFKIEGYVIEVYDEKTYNRDKNLEKLV